MASLLYFNGVDSVSISKRLGHAQVSTTSNIYAHVIEEAIEVKNSTDQSINNENIVERILTKMVIFILLLNFSCDIITLV